MPTQRIKGQEVSIIITRDGNPEQELVDIKSCEFTAEFEIKDEGYLGEKTNRKDEVFNGVKGSLELHIHSGDIFDFMQAVKDRAQRNTPDLVFNIAGIFAFPSGELRTATIPDVKFGAIPISTNARGDYTSVKLEFASEDYTVVAE